MNSDQIQAQLDAARRELETATGASERANGAADRNTPGLLADGSYDSAVLSGIRRKPNPRADTRRWNSYTRAAEAQVKLDRLRDRVRVLENRLVDATVEETRVRFTRDDLAGATHVKDSLGWHMVVRLNQTTVSVSTGYSWTDRIPFDKVLSIHRAEPSPRNRGPE